MKNTAIVFFLFLSVYSFSGLSQFELPDLIRLSQMQQAEFELFVLQKGYDFKKSNVDHECRFVHYSKYNEVNKRYICTKEITSSNIDANQGLNYQSSSNKDLMNLKEYIESNGYELISETKGDFDDRQGVSIVYKKGDIELWFFQWDDWFELNIQTR